MLSDRSVITSSASRTAGIYSAQPTGLKGPFVTLLEFHRWEGLCPGAKQWQLNSSIFNNNRRTTRVCVLLRAATSGCSGDCQSNLNPNRNVVLLVKTFRCCLIAPSCACSCRLLQVLAHSVKAALFEFLESLQTHGLFL